MVLCPTITVSNTTPPPPPEQGFTITADKVSDSQAFTTIIHISRPSKPNSKVHLVRGGWGQIPSCLQADLLLDGNGRKDVTLQFTESQDIFASAPRLLELGCCTAFDPVTCVSSNTLNITIGNPDYIKWGMYAAVGLGVAYVLGNALKR